MPVIPEDDDHAELTPKVATRKRLRTAVSLNSKELDELYNRYRAPDARPDADRLALAIEHLSDARQELSSFHTDHVLELPADAQAKEICDHAKYMKDSKESLFLAGRLLARIESADGAEAVSSSPSTASRSNSSLPRLKLPDYSGDFLEWRSFYDQFCAAVHNRDLPDAQKFSYLVSCLKGKARDAVAGITCTAQNYKPTLELIRRRFGEPSLLIGLYSNRIVCLPTVTDRDIRQFRELIDSFQSSLREIRNLVAELQEGQEGSPDHPTQETSVHDLLLAPLLLQKLPPSVRLEWNRAVGRDPRKMFTLDPLLEFAMSEVEALESVALNTSSSSKREVKRDVSHRPQATLLSASAPSACVFCKGTCKSSFKCAKFTSANVKDRRQMAATFHLCFNCLGPHLRKDCPSKRTCSECHQGHHTLLHERRAPEHSRVNCASSQPTSSRLMQTALIKVAGCKRPVRVMLDSASCDSFVTESFIKEVAPNEVVDSRSFTVEVFESSTPKRVTRRQVEYIFSSLHNSRKYKLKLWSCASICSALPAVGTHTLPRLPEGLEYAECFDDKPMSIDMLIGLDALPQIVSHQESPKFVGNLILTPTILGWVACGSFPNKNASSSSIAPVVRTMCQQSLTAAEAWWELDAVGVTPVTDEEDFRIEITRKHDRYEVALPWAGPERPNLSYEQARMRARSFHRLPDDQKEKYVDSLKEWVSLGVLESSPDPKGGSFLPHHRVLQGENNSKMRVVFDGAAIPWNGKSINQCLLTGPNLVSDLVAILLRFRFHVIVIVADVEKAFLMVGIREEDREYLKIVWQCNDKLTVSRFARLPFGLNSSIAILHKVVHDHINNRFPLLKPIIQDMYVDDLVTGFPDVQSALDFREQTVPVFAEAGMNLRKWSSSSEEARTKWGASSEPTKVLGLGWSPAVDEVHVNISLNTPGPKLTKRLILKHIAKVFDPLGIASPFVIRLRMIFQELWSLQVDWDSPVPQEVTDRWAHIVSESQAHSIISLPRVISVLANSELHTFADASMKAYGAVVYVKTGEDSVFVMSRARLAPLKPVTLTLPRLELMAALTAVRLTEFVSNNCPQLQHCQRQFYSDSMIVLGWIRGSPKEVFVRNRVREILLSTSADQWSHVDSASNPADLPSRGIAADVLQHSTFWRHGPDFLREPPCIEQTPCVVNRSDSNVTQEPLFLTDRWSTLSKAATVVELVLKFVSKCRKGNVPSQRGTVDPLDHLIKEAQWAASPEDCALLRKGKDVLPSSPIWDARPYWDTNRELIMCTPRNGESVLPWLPHNSRLCTLIVEDFHRQLFHQGPSTTVSEVCKLYWLKKPLRTVKAILSSCVSCKRLQGRPLSSTEGSLPSFRVTPSAPFASTGLDHFGPLYTRDCGKAWVLLFTCAVVRAVHLEVVSSLDEHETMLAIRRFNASRGIRDFVFYSDNYPTFCSLARLLKGNIVWKTIPEAAPWWGGFWERMVGTVKRACYKTLGNSSLSKIELSTVMAELGERINRRPLCKQGLEDDPITPAHFLFGASPPPLIPASVSDLAEPADLTRRWRQRLVVSERLWCRWKSEYLQTLRNWRSTPKIPNAPRKGDVVLVQAKPLPRLRWPLATIEELIVGPDGEARAAYVRCRGHVTRRPLCLLFPLECKVKAAEPDACANIDSEQPRVVEPDIPSAPPVKTRTGRSVKRPARYN